MIHWNEFISERYKIWKRFLGDAPDLHRKRWLLEHLETLHLDAKEALSVCC